MDIREILKVLPHRYPFLLVDRVLEADERRFKALKNVTFNEPHFQGHFPGHPVMPGVLNTRGFTRRMLSHSSSVMPVSSCNSRMAA